MAVKFKITLTESKVARARVFILVNRDFRKLRNQ